MAKMLKTIWKFPLAVADVQHVSLPSGAKVVHMDVQNGMPCMWVLLDPNMPTKQWEVLCFGTGHEVLASADRHIGTVLVGQFVWHYFRG